MVGAVSILTNNQFKSVVSLSPLAGNQKVFCCPEELNQIAAVPQFVSRISGAHFIGFCHAATVSITDQL
jgi:hypothetical protein